MYITKDKIKYKINKFVNKYIASIKITEVIHIQANNVMNIKIGKFLILLKNQVFPFQLCGYFLVCINVNTGFFLPPLFCNNPETCSNNAAGSVANGPLPDTTGDDDDCI